MDRPTGSVRLYLANGDVKRYDACYNDEGDFVTFSCVYNDRRGVYSVFGYVWDKHDVKGRRWNGFSGHEESFLQREVRKFKVIKVKKVGRNFWV